MAAAVARSRLRGNAARRTVNADLKSRRCPGSRCVGLEFRPVHSGDLRERRASARYLSGLARKRFAARIVVIGDGRCSRARPAARLRVQLVIPAQA